MNFNKFIVGSKIKFSGEGYEITKDDVSNLSKKLNGTFEIVDNTPPGSIAGLKEGMLILSNGKEDYVVYYEDAARGKFSGAHAITASPEILFSIVFNLGLVLARKLAKTESFRNKSKVVKEILIKFVEDHVPEGKVGNVVNRLMLEFKKQQEKSS